MASNTQYSSQKNDFVHADKIGDIAQIERATSPNIDKDHINYDRVDKEVAKYASDTIVEISEVESKRLRRLIDKRVLSIMIFTYFLQALDKGISMTVPPVISG